MFSSGAKRLAALCGAVAIVVICNTGPAAASCSTPYCGSYHGHTSNATDPVGHTSIGGPLGFVVNSKGVVSLTANVSWWCFRGPDPDAPYTLEAYHFDRTFKAHPSAVSKKGKVFVDKHFGDLHMSMSGQIKKGKFSGYFALGLLSSDVGCGTATMPATAKKK